MKILSSVFKSSSRRVAGDKSKDISALNAAIGIIDAIKETVEILPVKGVFMSASILLALIRVSHDLLARTRHYC